jgi:predicted MFS family arabinose efflux permease
MAMVIPKERGLSRQSLNLTNFLQAWRYLVKQRVAVGSLAFMFLLSMGNDTLFVVYGVWLESSFSLSLVAIGSVTTVIGLAELSGSTLTITMADRIGLKRAVAVGVVFVAISYAVLPLIGHTLPLALIGLFILFISFEFSVVTSYSLFTEVLPAQRATMMSALVAISGLGRVIGAFRGGPLWQLGGLSAIGLVSAMLTVLALGCFLAGLHRWQA